MLQSLIIYKLFSLYHRTTLRRASLKSARIFKFSPDTHELQVESSMAGYEKNFLEALFIRFVERLLERRGQFAN